ncbi:hypothetical protein KVT40_004162 [Elsinoe batatas]|uniref:WD40 repeat-like protein n=1 Tax=Elsinoe batatas TaxID=2601811 RepID=A0A8K0PJZ5_9PEZI|nr:hypothetical protein KVT40_004162 [Elsinoe batatas]
MTRKCSKLCNSSFWHDLAVNHIRMYPNPTCTNPSTPTSLLHLLLHHEHGMTSFPTKPLARLGGHNGQVLALTYSSGSGQYLLTASTDRLIRLFSPLSRSPLIQTFSAHGYLISDLCISSTNATFLSCGGDKIVFLWDVSTASTLRRWAGHAGRINAVRFAGDEESVVVSGSYDGTVKIWDVKQRGERPVVTWGEAGDSVAAVEVGDTEVWVGSVDGRVRGYDVRTGKVVVDVIGAPVTSLSLAKAGDAYLVGTLDSTLRLMDRRDGKCLQTFKDGEASDAHIAWERMC